MRKPNTETLQTLCKARIGFQAAIEQNLRARISLEQLRHIDGHCSRIPEQLRRITRLRLKKIDIEKVLGSKKDEFLGRERTWNLPLKKKSLSLLLCVAV